MGPKEKSFWKLYSHFKVLTGSRKLVLQFFLNLANTTFLKHWHISTIVPSLITGTSSWEAASSLIFVWMRRGQSILMALKFYAYSISGLVVEYGTPDSPNNLIFLVVVVVLVMSVYCG